MYSSVSVDGFIADENDQPGPLFDWLSSGDVPLDESGDGAQARTEAGGEAAGHGESPTAPRPSIAYRSLPVCQRRTR